MNEFASKERTGIPRRALKIHEAAQALGVSVKSVRRLIERGEITPCRVFRHVLIPIDQIDRLLNAD